MFFRIGGFFVSGLLNSAPARAAVQAYIVLHPDPHILERIRVPKYDPTNLVHGALAEASKEAHEAAAQGDEARLREIEERVDTIAARLWNLTDKELAGIRKSLGKKFLGFKMRVSYAK